MPATPAWPPSSLPRLFVDQLLREGSVLTLDGVPANYLANVLRLQPGAQVKLFDDRTGEWLAQITDAGKKRLTLAVTRNLRPREPVPDIWLVFAAIKKNRIDLLVEKATELGAARRCPSSPSARSSTASTSSGCAPTRLKPPSSASGPPFPPWTNR